jgi:hypothetical protein
MGHCCKNRPDHRMWRNARGSEAPRVVVSRFFATEQWRVLRHLFLQNSDRLDVAPRYGIAILLIAGAGSVSLASDSITNSAMVALSAESLPASATGMSTESGPGVPDDFSGTVQDMIPLTAAQQAGVQEAIELRKKRNPATQDSVDRGFAPTAVPATGYRP